MLAGFYWRSFATELRLFEVQAGSFGRFPFAGLRLLDEFREVGMFRRGHFSCGKLFVHGAFHAGQPGGVARGASRPQRSNQRQVVVLHYGCFGASSS
jgi:hypothetical protein